MSCSLKRDRFATGALSLILLFTSPLFSIAADSPLAWPAITSEMRPWAWWWWHGSAVDQTNLSHELHRFHDAGLGGVQITSIYGTEGAESRDIPYLTPQWLDMMGFTVNEAHRLGMGVDMTLGSGWCFGGPTVSTNDANASVIVHTYQLGIGERITGKINPKTTQALVAYGPDGKATDLTSSIAADGEVNFSPTEKCTVYAISQRPSSQKVKRAAPGGEGWMLNPAYPKAMRDWLKWFDGAFANYHGSKPHGVFQDSYEYRTDWSPDFFVQFKKLRGYKLQNELPALFGNQEDDRAARVKYDYRRTISDIMATESEPIWIDWAHKNGFAAIYQAHGTPGNWLDLYADADVPETEMFHLDRNILISKFASSAAHTQGRPLTGAETGTWLKEHFTATLADVKSVADDMFLSGVNHIYYHGACYSPDDAAWPGWVFYASTEMNPRNPIWHDVGTLNEYVARCQSIFQSSKPDNDILLYWPIADFWSNPSGRLLFPMTVSAQDWFESQPIGKAAHWLWNEGYSFDYVSDAQLQNAKVSQGKIQMPGGNYKLVVVPECQFMPPETLKQLLALAKSGARIVFENHFPSDVPGLEHLEARRKQFNSFLRKIKARKGKVFVGALDDALDRASAQDCQELFASAGRLSYVRLSFDGGWNYFIANRADVNFDKWIALDRKTSSIVLLDPMTGKTGLAAWDDFGNIHLQLAAGESVILRAFANENVASPAWTYWHTNGQPHAISSQWHIKFVTGGPTLPADFQTAKLASWTTFPDANTQAFAGTARYETTFDAPNAAGKTCVLNLGDVRQSARVKLNGKDYGTLIAPPFRVLVDNLKPTGNQLEVEVTSVAANRIRDLDRRGVHWKIFKDINVVNVNYRPFNAADWPLTDCGLLGPVTLTSQD
ncbi:MAG TPA: glycosyl hydrolase [Candidatus Angelobacter sp.]|nr:glycosyl hydrolase [Candidatus Angelobacter sp.]